MGAPEIRQVADGVYLTQPALSPSLWSNREEPAFELKFQLPREQAGAIALWAAAHLQLDPHADPRLGDAYHVHGLYFDTSALDVFNRSPGYKKRKYRVRRYGDRSAVFLEQKRKLSGKVAKRRIEIAEAELERLREAPTATEWTGHWFHRRIARRLLQPTCLISYERQAFFGHTGDGPLRLTLDRNVRSKRAQSWLVEPVLDGPVMLPEQVLLELKYRKHAPALFRRLMQDFSLVPAPLSKYRLAIRSLGHAVENGSRARE
jgi:hypothetical protein